jgi:hypothetical protein
VLDINMSIGKYAQVRLDAAARNTDPLSNGIWVRHRRTAIAAEESAISGRALDDW